MITRRRKAREAAIEILYRCDLLADDPAATASEVVKRRRLPERAAEYCRRLVSRTLADRAQIDELLVETLLRWRIERLSYVDRAILRMACCELLYFEDIPNTVSINEAVELAKLYGDEKSAQFVNGVLDAVSRRCSDAVRGAAVTPTAGPPAAVPQAGENSSAGGS